MSVYVDKMRHCITTPIWPYPSSCHLFADSIEELHRFAKSLGLKRSWFQDRKNFPHYDLTATKRMLAVRKGAVDTKPTS